MADFASPLFGHARKNVSWLQRSAAGMKSLPGAQSSLADTQALWCFAHNERVKPGHLGP